MGTLVVKKKYSASVLDAGMATTKAGDPQPFIKISILDDAGGTHELTWYGSLKSEKSTEIAVKGIIAAGYQGQDFSDLVKGLIMFNGTAKFTVELEHPLKDNIIQTDKFKVQWINAASTVQKFVGQVEKQTALFSKIRQETGLKKTTATIQKTDW